MAEFSILLQIAELVAILGTAALMFIRLGRIYQQIEQNTADVREMREEVSELCEAKVAVTKDTEQLRTRVDQLDRRVDRLETHPTGRIATA